MKRLKKVVFELESLVCEYCDADSSNCLGCLARKQVVAILDKCNIDTIEDIE